MMSEDRSKGKVTLEDLLRLKAAERPAEQFWAQFDVELRNRQLAAAVGKRRWWFSLSRVFAGLARYQMPIGAAAVLAVTFLTVREYREPGLETTYTPPTALPAAGLATEHEVAARELSPAPGYDGAEAVGAAVAVDPAPRPTPASGELSPMVPWAGPALQVAAAEVAMTPSARSIAENFAAADVEAELSQLLGRHNTLTTRSSAVREPLAEVTSPREIRRERLMGYAAVQTAAHQPSDTAPSPVRERLTSRLSEDQLYESVRRISAGGDRFTLKF